jgi:hypothetical protein
MSLPALEIDVDRSADFCQPVFVEATSQTFRINNLRMFADQTRLSFSWSVMGAQPDATDTSTLTISTLPGAGTSVTVSATVTSRQGLQAAGSFSFRTIAKPTGLKALQQELRCRLSRFRNESLFIRPWAPIERAPELQQQLTSLEKQVHEVTRAAAEVTELTRSMKKLIKLNHDQRH